MYRLVINRFSTNCFLVLLLVVTVPVFADGKPEAEANGRSVHDAHAINRWIKLPHDRQLLVLQSLGIQIPQNYFNCICKSAGRASSSASEFYHPGPIKNSSPSCEKAGPPCIVSGFGCGRYPLPSDSSAFEACAKIKGLDGGNPLDNIVDALADRRNRKALDGNPVVMNDQPNKEPPPDCRKQKTIHEMHQPTTFMDNIPPDRRIHMVSPEMKDKLANMKLPPEVGAALAKKVQKKLAELLQKRPELLKTYEPDELDIRIDAGDVEVAMGFDKDLNPYASEVVFKLDTPYSRGDKGLKFDFGVSFEPGEGEGSFLGHKHKAVKFGFAYEGEKGAEAKYGIEVNPNVYATDYYDGEWQKASEHKAVRVVENFLARTDLYIGGAKGIKDIGGANAGVEVSWKFKDRYSNWLFSDMNEALDNLLEHQKSWEEHRKKLIHQEAQKYGIDSRCFSTGQTIALTHKAYEKMKRKDPTLDKPFTALKKH